MSTSKTLNGQTYLLPDELLNYGHKEEVVAGTGDVVPKFHAIMLDAIADATQNKTTTSVTSNAIADSGSKTFVLAVDVGLTEGQDICAADAAAPTTNRMFMKVDSYNASTKTVIATAYAKDGSGTFTNWKVFACGPRGAQGTAGAGTGDMLKSENLSGLSDYATARTNMGLAIGTNVQAYDADTSKTDVAETRSASINMADNEFKRAKLIDTSEVKQDVTAATTTNINIESGNIINLDHGANITTLNLNNPAPTGNACHVIIRRIKDNSGTARTITWPASVKWPSASGEPTLTQTANAVDIFVLFTVDGGTRWDAGVYSLDSQ